MLVTRHAPQAENPSLGDAAAGFWPLTNYRAPGKVRTDQANEAKKTKIEAVQDLPSEIDEEEESL